jgi:phosphoglycerol transferase MdoB-like AlkP superfamily enzyme
MSKVRTAAEHVCRLLLHPAALCLVSVAGVVFAWNAENQLLSLPFSLAVAAALIAVLFLASSRAGFSVYLGWITIVVLTVVSATKYRTKGFSLHFYDLVFVGGDPEVYRFLVSSYLHLILPVMAGLVFAAIFATAIFRHDARTGWPLRLRTLPLALAIAMLPLTFPHEAEEDRYFYYMSGRQLSSFFVSLVDIQHLFVRQDLEGRLQATAQQPAFPDEVDCGDRTKQPDVYLVLSESQVNPAYFPQLGTGAGVEQPFSPRAGAMTPMFVETFGGGTWITNLSLMTGLPATDFGWRSPYLTLMLENKVGGALPELFARCGYRTVVIMPMDDTFVNEGPFLRSIGVETVLDIDDIAAPGYHLRDDFYFRAAEAFVARHRKEDGRPLFLEIQTMFPHSPYGDRMAPEIVVEGEPLHGDHDVSEYLRRVAIARGDFQDFLDHRAAEASERASLVLEFGDHHSYATKAFVDELDGPDALSRPRSLAYKSYFTLTAFGHPIRSAPPAEPIIDVGFLGASVLDAAGLPMSPVMADLVRLRDACHGAFYACADHAAVDLHLRRRVDSGMLDLFPVPPASAEVALHR